MQPDKRQTAVTYARLHPRMFELLESTSSYDRGSVLMPAAPVTYLSYYE